MWAVELLCLATSALAGLPDFLMLAHSSNELGIFQLTKSDKHNEIYTSLAWDPPWYIYQVTDAGYWAVGQRGSKPLYINLGLKDFHKPPTNYMDVGIGWTSEMTLPENITGTGYENRYKANSFISVTPLTDSLREELEEPPASVSLQGDAAWAGCYHLSGAKHGGFPQYILVGGSQKIYVNRNNVWVTSVSSGESGGESLVSFTPAYRAPSPLGWREWDNLGSGTEPILRLRETTLLEEYRFNTEGWGWNVIECFSNSTQNILKYSQSTDRRKFCDGKKDCKHGADEFWCPWYLRYYTPASIGTALGIVLVGLVVHRVLRRPDEDKNIDDTTGSTDTENNGMKEETEIQKLERKC